MDNVDEAQARTQLFYKAALSNRHTAQTAQKPLKVDANSNPICISCDVDITQRRTIVPHAQRCAECQEDADKRGRR